MPKPECPLANVEEILKRLQQDHKAALTAGDFDRLDEIQAELAPLVAQREIERTARHMMQQHVGQAESVARLRAETAGIMGYGSASRRWCGIADMIDWLQRR